MKLSYLDCCSDPNLEGVFAQDLPNRLKKGKTLALHGTSEFTFTNGFVFLLLIRVESASNKLLKRDEA